jgi:arsenite methyltransferase
VSGAISPGEVKKILLSSGFQKISINPKEKSEDIIREWNIGGAVEKFVFSAYIQAVKPDKMNLSAAIGD